MHHRLPRISRSIQATFIATSLCATSLCMPTTTLAQSTHIYPDCTKPPTQTEKDAARGLFQAGLVSYNEGDYPKAIAHWKEAYHRDCTAHLLLINIASAHEKTDEPELAITALTTYLTRSPDAPNRVEIERRIENLRSQIKTTQPTEPTAEPTPDPPQEEENETTTDQQPTKSTSIAPWILVGAGSVAAVSGLTLIGIGQAKISDAENTCPDRNNCSDKDAVDKGQKGRTQTTAGWVVTGIGTACIAGGLIWHFAFNKPNSEQTAPAHKPHWQPIIAPNFAGISVNSSF